MLKFIMLYESNCIMKTNLSNVFRSIKMSITVPIYIYIYTHFAKCANKTKNSTEKTERII